MNDIRVSNIFCNDTTSCPTNLICDFKTNLCSCNVWFYWNAKSMDEINNEGCNNFSIQTSTFFAGEIIVFLIRTIVLFYFSYKFINKFTNWKLSSSNGTSKISSNNSKNAKVINTDLVTTNPLSKDSVSMKNDNDSSLKKQPSISISENNKNKPKMTPIQMSAILLIIQLFIASIAHIFYILQFLQPENAIVLEDSNLLQKRSIWAVPFRIIAGIASVFSSLSNLLISLGWLQVVQSSKKLASFVNFRSIAVIWYRRMIIFYALITIIYFLYCVLSDNFILISYMSIPYLLVYVIIYPIIGFKLYFVVNNLNKKIKRHSKSDKESNISKKFRKMLVNVLKNIVAIVFVTIVVVVNFLYQARLITELKPVEPTAPYDYVAFNSTFVRAGGLLYGIALGYYLLNV